MTLYFADVKIYVDLMALWHHVLYIIDGIFLIAFGASWGSSMIMTRK